MNALHPIAHFPKKDVALRKPLAHIEPMTTTYKIEEIQNGVASIKGVEALVDGCEHNQPGDLVPEHRLVFNGGSKEFAVLFSKFHGQRVPVFANP